MFIFILLGLIFLVILILFSFPQFSPIPYFPSNKHDLPKILKALDIQNDQVLIDLGAGDGVIIFEAAKEAYRKKLNTKFIAIDINPVLVFIMHLRLLLHPNRKNIIILKNDMFGIDFNKVLTFEFCVLTFYLYISPRFLNPMAERISKLKGKKKIVSYFYSIPNLKKKEKVIEGKNRIYVYEDRS